MKRFEQYLIWVFLSALLMGLPACGEDDGTTDPSALAANTDNDQLSELDGAESAEETVGEESSTAETSEGEGGEVTGEEGGEVTGEEGGEAAGEEGGGVTGEEGGEAAGGEGGETDPDLVQEEGGEDTEEGGEGTEEGGQDTEEGGEEEGGEATEEEGGESAEEGVEGAEEGGEGAEEGGESTEAGVCEEEELICPAPPISDVEVEVLQVPEGAPAAFTGGDVPSGAYELVKVTVYPGAMTANQGKLPVEIKVNNNGSSGAALFETDAWGLQANLDLEIDALGNFVPVQEALQGGGCFTVVGVALEGDVMQCAEEDTGDDLSFELPSSFDYNNDGDTVELLLKFPIEGLLETLEGNPLAGVLAALLVNDLPVVMEMQKIAE